MRRYKSVLNVFNDSAQKISNQDKNQHVYMQQHLRGTKRSLFINLKRGNFNPHIQNYSFNLVKT